MTPNRPTSTDFQLSDRMFEAMVEGSFDVIAILDTSGTITYASSSVRRVLGWEPEEIVGQSAFGFIRDDEVEEARERFVVILQGEALKGFHASTRHKDGSWRRVEYSARNLLDDPAVGGIVVNYRDVTSRVEFERALRESEERYQKAFHASPNAIVLSRIRDGVFLDVNEGFERITGHTREEMLGASSLELDHWRYPEERERLAAMLQKTGYVEDFEAHFLGKDGRERIGQISAQLQEIEGETCMITTARDITAEVASREKLRRATELLQAEHQQLLDKNLALRQILDHLQEEKSSYRHDLTSRVENLLRPLMNRLRDSGGHLGRADVMLLAQRVEMIVNRDVDGFQNNLAKLSARERDVCALIRDGLSTRRIAQQLGLSPETVNKHRQSIRRKLQIDHRGINLASFLRSR
jgi:PAS domain S-box-containing protein